MNESAHPPFWFFCTLIRSEAENYPDSKGNRLHDKTLRIQKLSDSDLLYTRGNCSGFVMNPERVSIGLILPFTPKWTNPK